MDEAAALQMSQSFQDFSMHCWSHMDVSKNRGTPKSSILMGYPYFWKHPYIAMITMNNSSHPQKGRGLQVLLWAQCDVVLTTEEALCISAGFFGPI